MIEIKEELLDIEGIKNSKKPLLDLFIRRTAVVTSTSESLTEKIIKDQWSRANKLTSASSTIAEFDFCNLGTFFISKNKAKKRIEKLLAINLALETNEQASSKLKTKKEVVIERNLNMIRAIKLKTKELVKSDL